MDPRIIELAKIIRKLYSNQQINIQDQNMVNSIIDDTYFQKLNKKHLEEFKNECKTKGK